MVLGVGIYVDRQVLRPNELQFEVCRVADVSDGLARISRVVDTQYLGVTEGIFEYFKDIARMDGVVDAFLKPVEPARVEIGGIWLRSVDFVEISNSGFRIHYGIVGVISVVEEDLDVQDGICLSEPEELALHVIGVVDLYGVHAGSRRDGSVLGLPLLP